MAKEKLPLDSFSITDGPSKFDLMASLFDGKRVKITCDILPKSEDSIKFAPKIEVIFQKIGMEDGSHESWIGLVMFTDENYESERRSFYYSSKDRKGIVHEKGRDQ